MTHVDPNPYDAEADIGHRIALKDANHSQPLFRANYRLSVGGVTDHDYFHDRQQLLANLFTPFRFHTIVNYPVGSFCSLPDYLHNITTFFTEALSRWSDVVILSFQPPFQLTKDEVDNCFWLTINSWNSHLEDYGTDTLLVLLPPILYQREDASLVEEEIMSRNNLRSCSWQNNYIDCVYMPPHFRSAPHYHQKEYALLHATSILLLFKAEKLNYAAYVAHAERLALLPDGTLTGTPLRRSSIVL